MRGSAGSRAAAFGTVARSSRPRRWRSSPAVAGWAFVGPSVVLLAVFTIYPLAHSLWLSLQDRHLFSPQSTFVGLGNFVTLMWTAEFWSALWNGTVFSVATVALQLLAGVATALLLHSRFRGRALVRGVILFPFVVPTIVAVLIWKWMLNDLYGVVNMWLIDAGIVGQPVLWLASPRLAMLTVIGINVWLFFPFITIHVLARLQAIPLDMYESARVDGAGARQRFWYITLPHLRSTIALVVLIRGIWMFNKFDSVWLLTEGGWGSVQQQGVHSKKRLPFFHCGKHSVRGRPDNWRSYPLKTAVWLGEHILPCATCFPSLSKEWLNLLRP